MARSITRAVRGASGMVTTFPPFRVITSVPVATLNDERFDVTADGFGHPQTVQREQRDP